MKNSICQGDLHVGGLRRNAVKTDIFLDLIPGRTRFCDGDPTLTAQCHTHNSWEPTGNKLLCFAGNT